MRLRTFSLVHGLVLPEEEGHSSSWSFGDQGASGGNCTPVVTKEIWSLSVCGCGCTGRARGLHTGDPRGRSRLGEEYETPLDVPVRHGGEGGGVCKGLGPEWGPAACRSRVRRGSPSGGHGGKGQGEEPAQPSTLTRWGDWMTCSPTLSASDSILFNRVLTCWKNRA